MQNILITGGAGFIGSHICLDFLEKRKNVYVIGEAFSQKQAWVEGALESVEKIIYKL